MITSNQNSNYKHFGKIILIRKLLMKFDMVKAVLREKFRLQYTLNKQEKTKMSELST